MSYYLLVTFLCHFHLGTYHVYVLSIVEHIIFLVSHSIYQEHFQALIFPRQ